MRKILIDGRLLSNHPTGISKYTKELINAFAEYFGPDNICVLVNDKYDESTDFHTIITRLNPYNPFHFLLFTFFIYNQDFSIYYSTFYSGIFFTGKGKKQVTTVHDLMYLRIKNYFSNSIIKNAIYKTLFNLMVRFSLRASNMTISVSDTTRNDLLKYFKTDSVIVGEGVNKPEGKPIIEDNIFEKLHIKKETYFLYVGNFRKQKNTSFLINAFIQSKTHWQLLMVGNSELMQHENKNIIFAGILSDQEVHCLYKNCLAFVMPSLYEGFGLPILEAYCAGARVLSSNQGALSEFSDLGISYFNPTHPDELIYLLNTIEIIPRPTENQINLVKRTYSWKNQTDKIIAFVESLNRA
jgi:glycosyltransferase involved in cell wall biosynthesis